MTLALLFALSVGSYYDQVKARYDAASAPKQVDEVLGWHAGRCFDPNEPGRAIGGLLLAERREGSDRGGPMFPKIQNRIVVLIHHKPEVYDTMSEELTQETKEWLVSQWDSISEPFFKGNALVSHQTWDDGQLERYFVRMDQDYILVRDDTADPLSLYCYFFKKLN